MMKYLWICLVLGCSAFATDTRFPSQVSCVKWQDASGNTVGTFCQPFTVKAGSNIGFTLGADNKTLTITAATTSVPLAGMYQVDGLTYTTIQSAITAAGSTGSVFIPSSYAGSDTYTNPSGIPIIDLRGGADAYRGYFYAPDFGVKDGAVDNTAKLQAWITAVATAQGEGLLPCGTFNITSQLNVAGTGRFTLRGMGDCSIIQFDGSTVPTALGSPDTTQRILIRVDGIKFISSTTGLGLAIDASHWAQSSIEHVHAFGVNKCILFGNVHALYDEVKKLRCSITGAGSYGVKFDSVANENSIYKARIITDASSTGVIVNTQGVKLYDVDVETGALIGIEVQSAARDTLISGAWLEGNQTNLQLASGAQGTTVFASEIDSGSTADITDNGATGTVMCGVRKTFVMQPCTLGSGLVTANSNPASAGTIRMAVGDSLKFRNTANSADITGLSVNGSDQVTVGGTAGIIAGPFISNSSTFVPANGILRMVKTDTIKFRNNANSADITAVALDGSDVVQLGTNATGVRVGSSGAALKKIITTTSTIDFAAQAANTCTDSSGVTLTGAVDGDSIDVGVPAADMVANVIYSAYVSAADTVKVRLCNVAVGASSDPASGTFRITVNQF